MRPRSAEEEHRRLDEDIEREAEKGDANQPQCPPLAFLSRSRQFPHDDDRRKDFDQRIEPESRQRNRARRNRGDDDDDTPDDIPAERDVLQQKPTPDARALVGLIDLTCRYWYVTHGFSVAERMLRLSPRGHTDCAVEANDGAVQHLVLHDVTRECGVLLRPTETRWERDLLPE